MTLEGIVSDNTPKPLRQRWADQVTSSSNRAHEAEIVWGDAKAANVLVDVDMDAWVISTLEMGQAHGRHESPRVNNHGLGASTSAR
ncbi:hypothetical protein V496_09689 [Pseudogymnoascus sp. VKM F-4515 (FW-2607)]|nr:hypothetical protein V496_09689 [Pseudogymnoascus sp. VKM F-4515 (FW-2607)]